MNQHGEKTGQSAGEAGGPARPATAPAGQDAIGSEALLRGRNEILIRHGAEIYRLRSTSKGKLILTK